MRIFVKLRKELCKGVASIDENSLCFGPARFNFYMYQTRCDLEELAKRNVPNLKRFRQRKYPVFPSRPFFSPKSDPLCLTCVAAEVIDTSYYCLVKPGRRVPRQVSN